MSALTPRLLLLAGAAAGYALLLATNPIRASLRDGLRCIRRYKQVWGILAFCGVAAALFTFAVQCYEWRVVPEAKAAVTPWLGWQPVQMTAVSAWRGLPPTLLSVAALFDCLVTLFPLSVLAAILFLVNWRGYQAVLYRGMVRRFGVPGALALHLALLACALASLGKPVLLFCFRQLLMAGVGARLLSVSYGVVFWLSFAFEYFVGVGLQIYLSLLCFGWVRGLTFDFDRLGRFAERRFAFVVKWAAVVLALSSLGINIPVILQSLLETSARPWQITIGISEIVLPVILLAFCSMQIRLILHNESLAHAFSDHFHFMRRYAGRVGWLVLIAGVQFWLLYLADVILKTGWGISTWPAIGWRLLVYPVLWAGLASWLLASWVCLFRRCETNRPEVDDLVQY